MALKAAMAAEEVNVSPYRQPFLVEPMFNEFTKETGIKVDEVAKGFSRKAGSRRRI